MRRILAALTTTAALVGFPVGPAQAVTPNIPPWPIWTVEQDYTLVPGEYGQFDAICPEGYLLISGGFAGPAGGATPQTLFLQGEYSEAGGYTADLANAGSTDQAVRVFARCAYIVTVDIDQVVTSFPADSSGYAGGYAVCPTDEYALRASEYWSNANSRYLDSSSPTWDLHGWYAAGRDTAPNNAKLNVVLWCTPKATLPG